jgi:hypothetical protein
MSVDARHQPAPDEPRWRPNVGTLVGLAASVLLLVLLYRTLDVRAVAAVLARSSRLWLLVSIGMIVPITILRAVRFYWVAPPGSLPHVAEAIRLTLVSSALNVFVPAKAGDLVKSYFVRRRGTTSSGVSIAIVVYERLCDLVGLTSWCVAGWLLSRRPAATLPGGFWMLLGGVAAVCAVLTLSERAAQRLPWLARAIAPRRMPPRLVALVDGWPDLVRALGTRKQAILGFSVGLWLTHLVQLWLFTLALRHPLPFALSASLSAVALMAGQLPLTFAGVGARDVALVVLLSPYMPGEAAAAIGLLTATRNLLPPLLGAPLIGPYLRAAVAGMNGPSPQRVGS